MLTAELRNLLELLIASRQLCSAMRYSREQQLSVKLAAARPWQEDPNKPRIVQIPRSFLCFQPEYDYYGMPTASKGYKHLSSRRRATNVPNSTKDLSVDRERLVATENEGTAPRLYQLPEKGQSLRHVPRFDRSHKLMPTGEQIIPDNLREPRRVRLARLHVLVVKVHNAYNLGFALAPKCQD